MKRYVVRYDLREWRQRLGITQRQAADYVGMSEPAYRRAECRADPPPLGRAECSKTLALLCQRIEHERRSA